MPKIPDAVSDPRGYAQSQAQAPDRPPLHHIQQRRFVPAAHGGEPREAPHAAIVTVDLGGERMRCIVRKVLDEDTVILEITGVPMSRNHGHKQGDFVGARRQRGLHGGDEWKAVNERIINEIERRRLAEERQARLEAKSQAAAKRPPARRRGEK
ncbi:MAG TPA: hypothetical protein VEI03_20005 [Stellaceae bacterium]|nr:hypothetical protein [Stellaceae bacterium]